MKRLGVAAIITNGDSILMGRRDKDPNRGLFVFPGGGVEEGETLEEAFCREVKEETGYTVHPNPARWTKPIYILELDDRVILFVEGKVFLNGTGPVAGSDLKEVQWFHRLPEDSSPVIQPVYYAFKLLKENEVKASYYDPYDAKYPSAW